MILKKDNVERVAEGEGAVFWKRKGYREVPEKTKYEMSVDELRAAAAERGIPDAETLTKKKLLEALRGVTI